MIRLLRHDDTVHREDDGVVRFDDLVEMFQSRFAGTSHGSIEACISSLAEGGGPKKRFQYCMNLDGSKHLLFFRAIQGHAGGALVVLMLLENVMLPDEFAEYMHSIIQGGLMPGGGRIKRDRRSVFFHSREPDVLQSRFRRS